MRRLIQALPNSYQSLKSFITNGLCPQALRATTVFAFPSNLPLMDQIYAPFIKTGHSLDPFLATQLISHLSKLGDFSRAIRFLYDTQDPDIVAYNALLSGFARFSQPRLAFELVNQLRDSGLSPDVFTLSSLIKACDSLEENEVSHGVCLSMGFGSGAYLASGLIENYARNGDVESAEKCFAECLVPDSVVWTSMVCGYAWAGAFEKGKKVFMEMRRFGLVLNEFSLTSVLGVLSDIRQGSQIHDIGLKMGLLCGSSIYLNNALMNMYGRFGHEVDAIKVFDEIPEPDVVSWTERIGIASDGAEALHLFKFLLSEDLQMNEYTVTNVLTAIDGIELQDPGKQIHAFCQKKAYLQVVCVSNSMISMYGKCGLMDDAKRIFDETFCRDSISWNSLIAGFSENGAVNRALEVFKQMQNDFMQPNRYTVASILEAVSFTKCPKQAAQIHSHMIRSGLILDNSMVCCLIRAYGNCSDIDGATKVYKDIQNIDVMHLNAMAATFIQTCHHADALELFQISREFAIEVDFTTFSIALKACSSETDLQQGKAIHSLALRTGYAHNNFVQSALIDLYCKCGSIGDAERVFEDATTENLASWNAMIMGYAHHGCCQEVFQLFSRMLEFGIKPDEISYLGVLTSCCHAGLVKEADVYINSMFQIHGLIPRLEHYACMVDMLGRVGLLLNAKKIIDQMPIQADAHIWQILLSACNIHGDAELGRVAARKLLELQPENESAYVLLSNIYASAGMWDDVRKLRKAMKEKTIQKEPGSSWIQVGESTHYFFAADVSHAESKAIYMALNNLYMQMLAEENLGDDDDNNLLLGL